MLASMEKLNGEFGVMIDDVSRRDLGDPGFRKEAAALWNEHGVLVVRGPDLSGTAPEEFLNWAGTFGTVDRTIAAARDKLSVADTPILRIGNVRDEAGEYIAQFSDADMLKSDADIRYDPVKQRPVWHTDSVHNQSPPIGSVLHCRQAPPAGGETLFADTRRAYAGLDASTQDRLKGLEAICSLAHHDKKISLYTPSYPVLTPEQRAANPPNRAPLVLTHPVSGAPALYGFNSATCAVVPKGTPISQEQLDLWDLEGVEDESVSIIRDLLPYVTGPEFTIKWSWRPGDIVVWDNRCTMHAATGFDDATELREMWRLILLGA